MLEREYSVDGSWNKQKVHELARVTGLKPTQVYKWNWDKRQSMEKYLEERIREEDLPEALFKVKRPNVNFKVVMGDSLKFCL